MNYSSSIKMKKASEDPKRNTEKRADEPLKPRPLGSWKLSQLLLVFPRISAASKFRALVPISRTWVLSLGVPYWGPYYKAVLLSSFS